MDAAIRYFNVNVGIKDTKKSVSLNVSKNYNVSILRYPTFIYIPS